MSEAVYTRSLNDSHRLMAIAVYVLYLLALPLGITAFVAVIMSYVGREETLGSVYTSHFDNGITIFWVFLAGMFIAVPLCFVVIGIPMVVALYIWVLYKVIKGLVRVVDDRPYLS